MTLGVEHLGEGKGDSRQGLACTHIEYRVDLPNSVNSSVWPCSDTSTAGFGNWAFSRTHS